MTFQLIKKTFEGDAFLFSVIYDFKTSANHRKDFEGINKWVATWKWTLNLHSTVAISEV